MTRRWAAVALVGAALISLAGCATGKDAVVSGGEFQFVAPGNQSVIQYEPAEARGTLRAFSGESLAEPGRRVGIQDFAGRVVVINVWGSWCGPCRAELADLQLVTEQLGAQGVTVLGLDIRDTRDAAADLLRAEKITYPSIYDPAGRALLNLSGYPRNVVPSTIVLDRQHRVAAVYLTRIRLAEVMAVAKRLAAEPAA